MHDRFFVKMGFLSNVWQIDCKYSNNSGRKCVAVVLSSTAHIMSASPPPPALKIGNAKYIARSLQLEFLYPVLDFIYGIFLYGSGRFQFGCGSDLFRLDLAASVNIIYSKNIVSHYVSSNLGS